MTRNVWLAAASITLGFLIAEYVPGRVSTFYIEILGPFLGSVWLGHALTRLWSKWRGTLAAQPSNSLVVIVTVFGLLLLLGGFRLLWVDPALFGLAIAPMVEAIKLLLMRRRENESAL